MTILQATHNFLTDNSLTVEDVIKIILVVISLIGVWYSLKIQITKVKLESEARYVKLESELNIRLNAIESKNEGALQFLEQRLAESTQLNREDHEQIKRVLEKLADVITEMKVHIAEK